MVPVHDSKTSYYKSVWELMQDDFFVAFVFFSSKVVILTVTSILPDSDDL